MLCIVCVPFIVIQQRGLPVALIIMIQLPFTTIKDGLRFEIERSYPVAAGKGEGKERERVRESMDWN